MLRSDGISRLKAGLAVGVMMGGVLAAGCAPVHSMRLDSQINAEGLVYFLPKRDIVVTLTKGKDSPDTLTITPGNAYADRSARYVLTVSGTPMASRDTDIKVSAAGLLESSVAKLESKVALIAAEIAKMGAQVPSVRLTGDEAETCKALSTYTVSIDPEKPEAVSLCGLKITVTAVDTVPISPVHATKEDMGSKQAGYYYRQGRPYRVKVCPKGTNTEEPCKDNSLMDEVVSSPTGAPAQFLPVSSAFFADNTNTAVFNEGTLREYKEVKNSELLGAASIPAGIISAYFSAASSLFDFMTAKDTDETEALNAKLALDALKLRFDACQMAFKNKDDAAADRLGCATK